MAGGNEIGANASRAPALSGARRILYVSLDEVPAPKGAAVHIQQFAMALAQWGELTLVTASAAGNGCETRVSEAGPYRHIQFALPEVNFLDRVMLFREKLAALLRAERFDVIQFRSIWEGVVAAALGAGARLVYEVNAFPSIELKYLYPGISADLGLFHKMRGQELSLLVRADRIVTPSPVTAEFIEKQGILPAKIRLIANGVDAGMFAPPAAEPPGPPLELLYAGTLAPWQGLEVLYRALRSAGRQLPSWRLRVVGPSRKQWVRRHARLVEKLALHDRVEFLDAVPQVELAALVRQAHICVAPLRANDRNTVQGCCPLKVLEYAAAGRAIVAADLPSVRAVVENGVTAVLYNPRKVSHLRRAILELAGDGGLRRRLGEAARARVLEEFTWEAARRRLLDCYADMGVGAAAAAR